MAFNDALLRGLLKTLPVDGVPDLIVSAVRKKLDSVQSNEDEIPVIIILPRSKDNCTISIGAVKGDLDVPEQERYDGKEFVKSLLKEVDHA